MHCWIPKKNFLWINVPGGSSNVLGMFSAHLWPVKCSDMFRSDVMQYENCVDLKWIKYHFKILGYFGTFLQMTFVGETFQTLVTSIRSLQNTLQVTNERKTCTKHLKNFQGRLNKKMKKSINRIVEIRRE